MAEAGAVAALVVVAGVVAAAVFGGMVFFAFVYAPLVFIKLPAETAGPFIRAVFPVYYKVMGAAAFAAGLFLMPRVESFIMIAVGAVFFLVMLLLMPRINAARDASVTGAGNGTDGLAAKRFSRLHRASVIINFVQMLAVLAVVVRLLA